MAAIGKTAKCFADPFRYAVAIAASLWCCLLSFPAIAGEPEHDLHLHEPVVVSESLGWSELIDQTLINYPQYIELSARGAEARALAQRARKWFSGPPAAYAGYLSDEVLDSNNLAEYEVGFELPLWRLNERDSARRLGNAAASESNAATAALRYQVTGLLRESIWDIESARVAVDLAETGVTTATELMRIVTRRFEAGDLPQTDVLLAESILRGHQVELVEAEALLTDAERAYRSLSGLDRRPASFSEALNPREDIDDDHPWLMMADTAVVRAEAALDLATDSARGAPVVTIGMRRERAPFDQEYFDSVGVQFRMPFGGDAHRSAQTASSARAVANARAERAQLVRRIELELHEAHHMFDVVAASLSLATAQSALADRRLTLSERAFAQGEMSLSEMVLQRERAQQARMEVARLDIERQRAIAAINQALGESP